jgi:hypothetical protein
LSTGNGERAAYVKTLVSVDVRILVAEWRVAGDVLSRNVSLSAADRLCMGPRQRSISTAKIKVRDLHYKARAYPTISSCPCDDALGAAHAVTIHKA